MRKGSAIRVLRFGCRNTDIAAARAANASLGFTLLELLVAMAILGLMVSMLFAAFGQASRGWLQAENRVETFTQARAALDFMSRELSQAMATTNISFLGGVTNVAFVAPISTDLVDGADLLEVVYRLNGDRLERQISGFIDVDWDFYTDPQYWPSTTSITNTLADNVVSLQLSYVDTSGVNPPTASWNSTTAAAWFGIVAGSAPMLDRAPAGVQITIGLIDSKTANRLQPGMSATISNNIIIPSRRTFTTFVAIPNRQP